MTPKTVEVLVDLAEFQTILMRHKMFIVVDGSTQARVGDMLQVRERDMIAHKDTGKVIVSWVSAIQELKDAGLKVLGVSDQPNPYAMEE